MGSAVFSARGRQAQRASVNFVWWPVEHVPVACKRSSTWYTDTNAEYFHKSESAGTCSSCCPSDTPDIFNMLSVIIRVVVEEGF